MIKDITQIYGEYKEINKVRAFLYSPANIFIREIEMISPVLNWKKTGFSILDFKLPATYFDVEIGDKVNNILLDEVLDGYEVELWFGDLTSANYNQIRFIIKNRPNSLNDEKPTYSYSALSAEYALQKLPVINWPGIEVMEYKDATPEQSSQTQTGDPLVSNPVSYTYTLKNTPKDGKIRAYRMHSTYQIEIPLFEKIDNGTSTLGQNEFSYNSGTKQVTVYVPANNNLPTDNAGTIVWSNPVDKYIFNFYYETDETPDVSLVESPYYNQDGLTMNEVVEDLFNHLNSTQYFSEWTYDSENSITVEGVRSGLNFSNTNLYDVLMSLAENYQVSAVFDTVNKTFSIKEKNYGQNRGLRFEYGKYLKGIEQEYNTDDLINYIQGADANNIGFADVSWSGDNFIENYDYYLDGAYWNGSALVGTSRWLSTELATELAKIKYYQTQYTPEVWGNGTTLDGLVNIRYDLQAQVAEKELQLEEYQAEMTLHQGLIDTYKNETAQVKAELDQKAYNSAYNIPIEKVGFTENISLNNLFLTPLIASQWYTTSTQSFSFSQTRTFDSIKINGSGIPPFVEYHIDMVFYNGPTAVHSEILTHSAINNQIILSDEVQADSVDITFKLYSYSYWYQTLYLNELIIIMRETSSSIISWSNFEEYQTYLLTEAQTKYNNTQIEIDKLTMGTNRSFNSSIAINEVNFYGIKQLEERLEYIRQFTSVNYVGLSADALSELKRIRKGAVYQNNDIVDSKTLFEAAQTELLEKIYPTIKISISSVSILQAYEAYEDWQKIIVGEKVDIYVPELKIDIEADIQEINLDFQNYSMSLVISTTQNYDRSFGKYLGKTYKNLNIALRNEINAKAKETEEVINYVQEKEEAISILTSGSSSKIGYPSENNDDETTSTSIEFPNVYIDLVTETLVSEIPYITSTYTVYNSIIPGNAYLTNGGLYIRDENEINRIQIDAKQGFIARNTDNVETVKIDLEGNAYFAGELQAASGSFGDVTIDAAGELSVGNIRINNEGITAVDGSNNQTLFIDADNGSVYIKGTIKEGTTFEDIIARSVNVIGGTRVINYDENGDLVAGTTGGTFEAKVFANGIIITSGVTYSWSAAGVLSGTSTSSTFSPTVSSTYSGTSTQINLTVTYPDSRDLEVVVPIVVTRGGIQGVNGYNQAHIYLYKRSASAPTLGTIAGTYTFATGVTTLTTNTQSWSLTIPTGTDPLYISVTTVSSQDASATFDQDDFTSPVKFAEDGTDGNDGLNVASVYVYKRANSTPSDKPTGNTTYTFATGAISFTTANGWSATPPSTGGDNLYVRIATASNTAATDIIADTEWSSANLLAPKGDPAFTLVLTNESHVAPSNPDGSDPILTGSGGSIELYQSGTKITSGITYQISGGTDNGTTWTKTQNGLTMTVNETTGVYSLSETAWDSTDIETFILQAVYNTLTYSKTYKITKAKKGTTGDDAVIYAISSTSEVITKQAPDATTDGVHSSVTVTGVKYEGIVTTSNVGFVTITGNGSAESGTAVATPQTLSPANDADKSFYTIKLYNDAAKTTLLDTKVINIVFKGNTGATGATGNGISTITNYYLATSASSGVTTSTPGWTTAVQTTTTINKYLWNYETITYTDTSSVNTSPRIIGTYGDTGDTGNGISSIDEKYAVSTSNVTAPTVWFDTPQTMTVTDKYLWSYEIITYTDLSTFDTDKRVIGVYGDTGETGPTGDTGPQGPGIVYRGEYDNLSTYYSTTTRQDIVLYNSVYYKCIVNNTTGTWNASNWATFENEFDSVATDILFAQDVYANRTINIGANEGAPVIALNSDFTNGNANPYIGINKSSFALSATNGIFLGYESNTPKFSIGTTTKGLTWDGNDLIVKGEINASSGTIADFTINSSGISTDIIATGAYSSQLTSYDWSGLKFENYLYDPILDTNTLIDSIEINAGAVKIFDASHIQIAGYSKSGIIIKDGSIFTITNATSTTNKNIQVKNLVDPTNGPDAVNKDYVDNNYLPKALSTTAVTPASGDYILITDANDSNNIKRGPVFGSSTTTFLTNTGLWTSPYTSANLSSTFTTSSSSYQSFASTTLASSSYYEIIIYGMWSKATSGASDGPVISLAVNSTTGTPTFNGVFEWLTSPSATVLTMENNSVSISTVPGSLGFKPATTTSAITASYFGMKGILYTGTTAKTVTFYLKTDTASGNVSVEKFSLLAIKVG